MNCYKFFIHIIFHFSISLLGHFYKKRTLKSRFLKVEYETLI
nr:MAG TPA_asm: hypothetical protein [Caudoviricetes sp.]